MYCKWKNICMIKLKDILLEACHYTNLQPMWADENLSKGKKVEIFEKKV